MINLWFLIVIWWLLLSGFKFSWRVWLYILFPSLEGLEVALFSFGFFLVVKLFVGELIFPVGIAAGLHVV